MGSFTDRIKRIISGRPVVNNFDDIEVALYAIRLSDKPDFYLHPVEETRDAVYYLVRKGIVGAAFWKWKEGMEFIKSGNESNLEMVMVDRKFLDEQNAKSK